MNHLALSPPVHPDPPLSTLIPLYPPLSPSTPHIPHIPFPLPPATACRYRPPQEVQRPGAPYKKFEHAVIYHPKSQTWETEGEALDSAGNARIQYSAPQSLAMGMRR